MPASKVCTFCETEIEKLEKFVAMKEKRYHLDCYRALARIESKQKQQDGTKTVELNDPSNISDNSPS